MNGNGDSDQGSEEWSHFGFVLKLEPTFPDGWDVGWAREESKVPPGVLSLNN